MKHDVWLAFGTFCKIEFFQSLKTEKTSRASYKSYTLRNYRRDSYFQNVQKTQTSS